MTVCVDFEPVGRRGECPSGQSLLDCARRLGVDLVSLCGGAGSCGRCIVQILAGEVSEPVPSEGAYLSACWISAGGRGEAFPQSRTAERAALDAESLIALEGDARNASPLQALGAKSRIALWDHARNATPRQA